MTEPEVLDSRDELAQLRAENERLRAMVAHQPPPDAGRTRRPGGSGDGARRPCSC